MLRSMSIMMNRIVAIPTRYLCSFGRFQPVLIAAQQPIIKISISFAISIRFWVGDSNGCTSKRQTHTYSEMRMKRITCIHGQSCTYIAIVTKIILRIMWIRLNNSVAQPCQFFIPLKRSEKQSRHLCYSKFRGTRGLGLSTILIRLRLDLMLGVAIVWPVFSISFLRRASDTAIAR